MVDVKAQIHVHNYSGTTLIQHFDNREYLYNLTIHTVASTSYFLYEITQQPH